MALDPFWDSPDDVPEFLRDTDHIETDAEGRVRLVITPRNGFALEDVSKLKKTANDAREAETAAQKKIRALQAKLGDLDVDAARKAMTDVESLREQLAAASQGDAEETRKLLEQKERAWKEQMDAAVAERDGRIEKLTSGITRAEVKRAITAALAKHGAKNTEVLEPYVTLRADPQMREDGEHLDIFVRGDNGEHLTSARPGQMKADVDEFVESLRKNKAYAPFFDGSGNSGSGQEGGTGDATGETGPGGSGKPPEVIDDGGAIDLEKLATGEQVRRPAE